MFNLKEKDTSYIIVSPEKDFCSFLENKFLCDKLCNILYAKGYTVFSTSGYHNGTYDKSFIAINNEDNDSLRKDSIYLMEEFSQKSIIIKYKGEEDIKKVLNNGSEKLLSMSLYETTEDKIYIYNGVSFSFKEEKRYHFLNSKNQLRTGMIVEFFNNNRWVERKVENVEVEYEKMYKLLIKYNKLRVCTE